MDELYVKLLTEQGAAVGVCLFFCFGMAATIVWIVKTFNSERKSILAAHKDERDAILKAHKEEREEAWKAHNNLLEKTIASNDHLSGAIEMALKAR